MATADRQAREERGGLRKPRFSLRALLAVVGLSAILLTLPRTIGTTAAAAITFTLIAVAAHVAGGVIGARLRQ